MAQAAPFGSWSSPIGTDMMSRAYCKKIAELHIDDTDIGKGEQWHAFTAA